MKPIGLLSCVVLSFFLAGGEVAARTFTDLRGRTIEATVVDIEGDVVKLRLDRGGKVVSVPIHKFSKADRAYFKRWSDAKVPDGSKDDETEEETGEDEGRKDLKSVKKKEFKPLELEEIVLNKELWSTSISEFEKRYRPNGFVFMSASRKGVRSEGKGFTLFGQKAGEVVVRSREGVVASVNISIYNRGDDGELNLSKFNEIYEKAISDLNAKTGLRPEDKSKKETVNMVRKLWRCESGSILLEKSLRTGSLKPDFLRVKIKPKNARSRGMVNRSSLRDNVVKDDKTGDVYVANVPMIDQGRKGYCAVASAARVYQYYGLEVDQHELAQIAGTGRDRGTSLGEMVSVLKKVTRHVRSRVLVLYEYPKGISKRGEDFDARDYKSFYMEFRRDLKNYNKIAKKRGQSQFRAGRDLLVHPSRFRRECEPEIYREVMMAKSSFRRFNNKVEEYINQGVPVGWCLQLGMFKEGDLPQSFGGHMRLIIGYNKKTGELIYTDSWGAGHGRKRMPAGNAFCMTTAVLVLPPNK